MQSVPQEWVQPANVCNLLLVAVLDWAAIAGVLVLTPFAPRYFYPA